MTMLEKVRAALIAEDEAVGGTRHPGYWDDMARVALEAMREPTEAICEAGNSYGDAGHSWGSKAGGRPGEFIYNSGGVWGAMVAAALAE